MGITQDHGKPSHWQPYQVKIIDGKAVAFRDVVVHTIRMGDVDDPDLYAAEPLWKWQESEQGKFVMKHAVDKPEWHRHTDYVTYGYKYAVTAELEAKKLSEFLLRWGPIK